MALLALDALGETKDPRRKREQCEEEIQSRIRRKTEGQKRMQIQSEKVKAVYHKIFRSLWRFEGKKWGKET